MRLKSVAYILSHLNFNTVYFNFKCFDLSTAIRFPVFLSKQIVLKKISGTIILPKKIYPGVIEIGYGDVGIFDRSRSRTILELQGKIEFNGKTNIGHGSKISVGKDGTLSFGENFNITAESSIVCFKQISFGNDCLLSWQVLVIDTDFHKVYESDQVINSDSAIEIRDNVWIGMKSTILKGVLISNGSVVAAGSLVNKKFAERNVILAGVPAKIMRSNIQWTI